MKKKLLIICYLMIICNFKYHLYSHSANKKPKKQQQQQQKKAKKQQPKKKNDRKKLTSSQINQRKNSPGAINKRNARAKKKHATGISKNAASNAGDFINQQEDKVKKEEERKAQEKKAAEEKAKKEAADKEAADKEAADKEAEKKALVNNITKLRKEVQIKILSIAKDNKNPSENKNKSENDYSKTIEEFIVKYQENYSSVIKYITDNKIFELLDKSFYKKPKEKNQNETSKQENKSEIAKTLENLDIKIYDGNAKNEILTNTKNNENLIIYLKALETDVQKLLQIARAITDKNRKAVGVREKPYLPVDKKEQIYKDIRGSIEVLDVRLKKAKTALNELVEKGGIRDWLRTKTNNKEFNEKSNEKFLEELKKEFIKDKKKEFVNLIYIIKYISHPELNQNKLNKENKKIEKLEVEKILEEIFKDKKAVVEFRDIGIFEFEKGIKEYIEFLKDKIKTEKNKKEEKEQKEKAAEFTKKEKETNKKNKIRDNAFNSEHFTYSEDEKNLDKSLKKFNILKNKKTNKTISAEETKELAKIENFLENAKKKNDKKIQKLDLEINELKEKITNADRKKNLKKYQINAENKFFEKMKLDLENVNLDFEKDQSAKKEEISNIKNKFQEEIENINGINKIKSQLITNEKEVNQEKLTVSQQQQEIQTIAPKKITDEDIQKFNNNIKALKKFTGSTSEDKPLGDQKTDIKATNEDLKSFFKYLKDNTPQEGADLDSMHDDDWFNKQKKLMTQENVKWMADDKIFNISNQ